MIFKKTIAILTATTILILPFLVFAALVPCGVSPGVGPVKECTVCDLFVLVKKVVDFLTEAVAMPVAVIILIYGGIMMLTSGGSEDKIRKGKSAVWGAVWGLVIVFAAWLIIDTIIKWLGTGGQGVIQNWGPWNSIPSGC
ncbi:MAG: hypothetical protein NTX55_00795 [Candidatus Parcubacteria bacterium]|nr:hypothetical protein [Candidatus Parcubacteria bacterium]